LNQLNYLIGKENIDQAVKELYKENKGCFSVLKILIAVRDKREIIASDGEVVFLDSYFSNISKTDS
ncbi:MAG TPA: restriction endonuclease, partial [Ignavibacteria bacterium]|nr:restriction endonuclease [Ignavibacteria bacterium]